MAYLVARAQAPPAVVVITDETPRPCAVAEDILRTAPCAHVVFVADPACADELAASLCQSPISKSTRWAVSPPDEERMGGLLACALAAARAHWIKARVQGGVSHHAAATFALADKWPLMAWSAAASGAIDYFNAEWGSILGISCDDLARHGWIAFVHDVDRLRAQIAWEQALTEGGRFTVEARLRARGGRWAWCQLEARQGQTPEDDGRWYGSCVVLRASRSVEEAWRFVNEVARQVTENLDYEATLTNLAQAVVPTFADWCAVDVINENGVLERVSLAHENPQLVREIMQRRSGGAVGQLTAEDVARTGEPQLVTHLDQSLIDALVPDPSSRAFFRSLGLRSFLRLPLKARGRTVGVITFVLSGPGTRLYAEDDLLLATRIAQQGAIAVENARLYRRARAEVEERSRAERALATSEGRYRSLVEASAQIVWSLDVSGCAGDDMTGWCAFTGQSCEDVAGYGWMAALGPLDREAVREGLVDPGAGHGPIVREGDLAAAVGGYRRVMLRIVPLFGDDGRLREWIAAATDITPEKTASELLAREKERLAVTLNSLGEAVITIDTVGRVALFNRVAQGLTGWSESEALGQSVDTVLHLREARSRIRRERVAERLLDIQGQAESCERFLLQACDGGERLVVCTAAPICDPGGRLAGAVAVFRDITAQQKLEEDFLKVQKLESVGVLAGGIAHDFNNILTAVIGNIALAKMQAPSGDRVEQTLDEAEKAAWRARGLTQQLLTFARGGAPVKRAASLGDLLREAVPCALAGSKAKCSVSVADDLWGLAFDPEQLRQAVTNLVLNAAQAMPSGGLISIGAGNAWVAPGDSQALRPGRYVCIIIADAGIGIPASHLDKIFDPYFTTKEGRRGLGLATTYSIIRRHEGAIRVESEEGRGTRFEIYLPAAEVAEPVAPPLTRKARRGRMLVVDRDEALLRWLAMLLDHLGYEVSTVRDGRRAVEVYVAAIGEGDPFTAVILDLAVAAGAGGEEYLRQLRTLDPNVRAIASSGHANDPIMADFARFGFCGAIAKPCQLRELEEVIGGVLVENGERLR
ncbi:MAG: PAS domain S-box protein [Acidiferrobacter sp.]